MKLAVIGVKELVEYKFISKALEKISNIELIISGGALGTDTLAKKIAIQNKIKFKEFPPDYKNFGEKAKHIRDKLIVEECDELIAFWDGKCEGTKYTMDYAKVLRKPVKIIQV